MSAPHVIRPMQPEDVDSVERLTDEAFHDLAMRSRRVSEALPARRTPDRAGPWRSRLRHMVDHDPAGCWVAEDGGRLVGAAASVRRETLWVLSTFAVLPDEHGRGIGRALLAAAGSHGDGALRAMISATPDPAAAHLYHQAGFSLQPWMILRGHVPRHVLPVVERVREGSAGDVDLMNSIDRQVRSAAHGPDHDVLLTTHRLIVADRTTGSGYAYVEPQGGTYLLAATNRRTAVDLLWEALAASSPDVPCAVSHVSAANDWAVDVGLTARLELGTRGFLALRGMKAPAPYLASGHFL